MEKFQEFGDEHVAIVFMVAWALWEARNLLLFQNQRLSVLQVSRLAISTLNEFLGYRVEADNVSPNCPQPNNSPLESFQRWKAPSGHVIKINGDASVQVGAYCGLGFIARNYKGEVMAAGFRRLNVSLSPENAEAEAMTFALNKALELGFTEVICEFDCLGLSTWSCNTIAHSLAKRALSASLEEQIWIEELPHPFDIRADFAPSF
ncbi:uncharacterized protein LOC105645411 [Jatropha curcas]|uniref:uncharacterized protein LOC105645411 n=1 Tax=Jatropha curcas TaxID=180498 RepID=UPI0005FB1F9E|nr:uncharacterized protein LOC105645411 [Jatropha curcas]